MIERSSIEPIRTLVLALGALLLFAACGSSNPEITPQLVDARRVVNKAQMSSTAKLEPAQMRDAWNTYVAAEKVHDKDPGSYKEAHLAYTAQRKAETANANAKTLIAMHHARHLDMQYQALLEHKTTQEMAQAPMEALDESAAALESLQGIADVKQNANTVVITLSSAVLFPTAGDSLSEGARRSLDKVAEAIQAQPQGSRIRVDGYTDSRGTDTFNEALSQRRAQSVSDYLAKQGVEGDKLSAEGKGESDPIASNDTPDGRANNRRAEIVIELPQQTAQGSTGMQPAGAKQGQAPPSSSAKTTAEPEPSPYKSSGDTGTQLPSKPTPPAPESK